MFIQGRAGIAEEKIGAGWWISWMYRKASPQSPRIGGNLPEARPLYCGYSISESEFLGLLHSFYMMN